MKRVGTILIQIIFVISSFLIIPLLWTIYGLKTINKMNRNEATEKDETIVAILGIIFAGPLGILGGILILVDKNQNKNNGGETNKTTTA